MSRFLPHSPFLPFFFVFQQMMQLLPQSREQENFVDHTWVRGTIRRMVALAEPLDTVTRYASFIVYRGQIDKWTHNSLQPSVLFDSWEKPCADLTHWSELCMCPSLSICVWCVGMPWGRRRWRMGDRGGRPFTCSRLSNSHPSSKSSRHCRYGLRKRHWEMG